MIHTFNTRPNLFYHSTQNNSQANMDEQFKSDNEEEQLKKAIALSLQPNTQDEGNKQAEDKKPIMRLE